MMEIRSLTEPVEFRDEGEKLVAEGYAARFDKLSQNLGGFVERIASGAFKKTVAEADVRALFNHDANMLLGRNRSGTLRLEETSEGLRYEIDLPNTSLGRDVAELLRRGDLSGSSFGFRVIDDEWGETPDGFPLRTLKSVALRDVGPVVYPAYVDAESALRSLAEARSLSFDAVAEAAANNSLSEVLWPSEEIGEERAEDDSREKTLTVVRHKYAFRTS